MKALIGSLRQRCKEKPGVTPNPGGSDGYSILGGFLNGFATFYLHEKPPMLMIRCNDTDRERLEKSSPQVRVSDRMKWDTKGWTWTDVPLDGSIPQESLLPLIDISYQIACERIYDSEKVQLSLLTRNVPPSELLKDLIKTHGLSRKRVDVEKLALTALLLKTTSTVESNLPPGQTKIGGRPDLPAGWTWPTYSDGKPLAFLAQINLSEVPAGTKLAGVPKSGILYFFSVFGRQNKDDADPCLPPGKYANDWTQVLFNTNESAALVRQKRPPNVNGFKAAKVEFVPITSLPMDADEPAVAKLCWSKDVNAKYEEMVSSYQNACSNRLGSPARNLFLGFAEYVQEFVEVVANDDLQLLLQLDSDSNADMCWGDGGCIYFWMRRQDLKRGEFGNVYTDYQCG